MKRSLAAAALVLALAGPLAAQESEIRQTIGAQIEAFRVDDFASAFTHASPSIQAIFGTPENFGAMVKKGFPMVWRPRDVRYLELAEKAGAWWQKVLVRDARGASHVLLYRMIEQDGAWKISGVQILRAPGVSA